MSTPLIDRLAGILTSEERQRLAPAVPTPEPTPVQPPPVSAPATRIFVPDVGHEYATMYPGNIDHRAYLLFHGTDGRVGLHKTDGTLHQMMPSLINTGSEPRWSKHRPTQFYYHFQNQLRRFDVADNSDALVRKFSEYPSITSMGEADLSWDGDHMIFCSGQTVFVYNIPQDKKITEFKEPWKFDNLYLTADNRAIVGFYGAEVNGVNPGMQIYDTTTQTLRPLVAALGHQDTGRDTDGTPILVWCNAADSSGENKNAALPNCKNGIVKVNCATGKQTCLLSLDWSLAVHISCPDFQPWCLVSVFDPQNPDSTVPYAGEILQVALDGSGAKSIGRHGALGKPYEQTPRVSVSRDGKRMIYTTQGGVVIRDV